MNAVFETLQWEKAAEKERGRTPSQAHPSRNGYVRYWKQLEQHHLMSQHKHLLLPSQRPILLPIQHYVCPFDAFKFVYNWYLRLLQYSSDTKMKLWSPSILIKPQGKMIWRNHHHAGGSIRPSTALRSLLHQPQVYIGFQWSTNTSFNFYQCSVQDGGGKSKSVKNFTTLCECRTM